MLLLCAKVVQTLIWINVLTILTEIALKFCDYWLYLHHVVSSELESSDLIPPRNKFFSQLPLYPAVIFAGQVVLNQSLKLNQSFEAFDRRNLKNFDTFVDKSETTSLGEFYSDFMGHTQMLLKTVFTTTILIRIQILTKTSLHVLIWAEHRFKLIYPNLLFYEKSNHACFCQNKTEDTVFFSSGILQ